MSEKINNNSNINGSNVFSNKESGKTNSENNETEVFLFADDINTSKSSKDEASIMGNLVETADDLLFSTASANLAPVQYTYSSGAVEDASLNGKSIYELYTIQNNRLNELQNARNNFNSVFNGSNDNVKSSTLAFNYVKKNYENLLQRERGLNPIQRRLLAYTNAAVEKSINRVDKAEILLKNVLNEVPDKQVKINEYKYNLDIYNEIIRDLENQRNSNVENNSEINQKIFNLQNGISDLTEDKSAQEKELDENMAKIAEIIGKKDLKKSDESTLEVIFDMIFNDNDNKKLSLSEEKAQFQNYTN